MYLTQFFGEFMVDLNNFKNKDYFFLFVSVLILIFGICSACLSYSPCTEHVVDFDNGMSFSICSSSDYVVEKNSVTVLDKMKERNALVYISNSDISLYDSIILSEFSEPYVENYNSTHDIVYAFLESSEYTDAAIIIPKNAMGSQFSLEDENATLIFIMGNDVSFIYKIADTFELR